MTSLSRGSRPEWWMPMPLFRKGSAPVICGSLRSFGPRQSTAALNTAVTCIPISATTKYTLKSHASRTHAWPPEPSSRQALISQKYEQKKYEHVRPIVFRWTQAAWLLQILADAASLCRSTAQRLYDDIFFHLDCSNVRMILGSAFIQLCQDDPISAFTRLQAGCTAYHTFNPYEVQSSCQVTHSASPRSIICFLAQGKLWPLQDPNDFSWVLKAA